MGVEAMSDISDLGATQARLFRVKLSKRTVGPDMMYAQADGLGNVWVEFSEGINAWGEKLTLSQEDYEALRQEIFRKELADLDAVPTYAKFYSPPGSSGGGTIPNGNTQGRVNGETPASGESAEAANPPVESETPAEDDTGDKVLDSLQSGLDVVGLIPGVGEIADLANAGISLARGDYAGAALSAVAAIPFVGWLGTAGKAARQGTTIAAEATAKAAKEAAEKKAKDESQKKAKEEAARKQASGGKVNAKKLPKKKPECFDPRQSDAYKKMSEAEKKKYLGEYARQLKRQEDAINSMSAKEFADARAMFERTKGLKSGGSGRNPLASKTQNDYREKRRKDIGRSIFESIRKKNPGMASDVADTTAKSRSKEIMENLAALHEPDMVAGGWHDPRPSGLGDRGINSAIGGSWSKRGRVPMLENTANDAVARGNGADMMNVELTVCPPGKKGSK